MTDHLYAVVLTGGRGTRFWPLSRRARPKQLLAVSSRLPLLRETLDRMDGLVPAARRCLVTPGDLAGACHALAPEVPDENVILEPSGRNTGPCLALAAAVLAARDPEAIVFALPADHHIGDPAGFRSTLRAAAKAASEDGALVTLGIRPSRPDTGYGYIQVGEALGAEGGHPVHAVERFVEKPDRATAEGYLASGSFLWNAGIFAWRASTFLDAVRRHVPDLGAGIDRIASSLGTPRAGDVLHEVWQELAPVSVDVGVLERAERVRVIPAAFGWSDVGSWSALRDVLPSGPHGVAQALRHVAVDTRDCVVVAPDHLVATVGVEGLLVVAVDDAVLVCDLSRDQDVRAIVDQLAAHGLDEYL